MIQKWLTRNIKGDTQIDIGVKEIHLHFGLLKLLLYNKGYAYFGLPSLNLYVIICNVVRCNPPLLNSSLYPLTMSFPHLIIGQCFLSSSSFPAISLKKVVPLNISSPHMPNFLLATSIKPHEI